MAAGTILFGFRDDVDLNIHWWHRLSKVVFAITSIPVAIFTLLLAHSGFEPERTLGNVTILTTLQETWINAPDTIYDAMPIFLQSPGELGEIRNGRIEFLYSGNVEKVICTTNAYKYADKIVEAHNNISGPGERLTVESFTQSMKEAGVKDGVCLNPSNVTLPRNENVVKYRFTAAAKASRWLKSIGSALMVVGIWWLLCGNLYYRGIVYTIIGPRQTSNSV